MNELHKKLQSILNKTFKYGIHIITFTGYEINEEKGRVYFHTNEKENHWDRPLDGINQFLKEFKNTEIVATTNSGTTSQNLIVNSTSITDQLKSVLLDNIEKVKSDREYIPQAKAINNDINSLINLQKLQLDYFKTAQKLRQDGE